MKKIGIAMLLILIWMTCLAVASADTPFAITETSQNEWTLFKDTGIMSRYKIFSVLFNATGLDQSKPITYAGVSAPFDIGCYEPEYYGINSDGWQADYSGHDFYGCVMFSIEDEVLQTLECKDYTLYFTISHNGYTATLSCLIHVVEAPPKVPTSLTGANESYTILPDETVTITPVLNPTDWAGTYATKINFFVNKKNSSGYAIILSDGTYALVTSEESEHLIHFAFDNTSMTVTGMVPGYYEMTATIFLPYANVYYDLRIPLTVLNPDGSAPLNKPMIYYSIDNDMSGDESSTYFYEITRYRTNLSMQLSCWMYDENSTGVLSELVDSDGAIPIECNVSFVGPNGDEYIGQVTAYTPYLFSVDGSDIPNYLSGGCRIEFDNLPAGDYQGSIRINWYGSNTTTEILLHRGYNPTGDPTGITGIDNFQIMHIGDKLTLPMAAIPSNWTAPLPAKWFSDVTSHTDWTSTSIYYEDDDWRISTGDHFTCQRTESASGFTDIYTAVDSGFYSCSISMRCADYEVSNTGLIIVLNQDGTIPDGSFSPYWARDIATVIIPDSTTKIESEAFANTPDNAIVFFPSTVNEIAQNAFSGVDGLIVLGYRNSASQSFAQQNGYSFVPVEN